VPFPMSWHRPVLDLGGAFADQDLGGDVRPRLAPGARPRNTQRPPGAQTVDQLTLQRTAALDIERLVDRLVADPHGLIIGKIQLDPLGDLLRTPAPHPAPIAAMRLVPALPP